MNRRSMLLVVLSAAVGSAAKPARKIPWLSKAKDRLERAAHFDRSVQYRIQSAARYKEMLSWLEKVRTDPNRQAELDQTIARCRKMLSWDEYLAAHYREVEAIFRRSAFRPWKEIPPRPESVRLSEFTG